MLLLFCGLPGSGKTTLAAAFARLSGWKHLHSDGIRRELQLMGDYSEAAKKRVYQTLLDGAEQALRQGENIIVDSTFYRKSIREPFTLMAEKLGAPRYFVEAKAPESVIKDRVSRPRPDSEADFSVYEKLRDQFEPIDETHFTMHTDTDEPDILALRLWDELARCGAISPPIIDENAIVDMIARGAFPDGNSPEITWLQTHISWVILTPQFAYKIKKNVRYSFLDFSTLEKRHFFCEAEMRLNSRLAPDMYLTVLPVGCPEGRFMMGESSAPIVDFALQMRRMDNRLEMDRLLETGAVKAEEMTALADILAPFHLQNRLQAIPADLEHPDRSAIFDDLFSCSVEIERNLGADTLKRLNQYAEKAGHFLQVHEKRLRQRAESGFWVDGHGDLHAKNIFLTRPPVIFDGIEFNRAFRMIDVLDELAFLCMDLNYFGRPDMETAFLAAYLRYYDPMPLPEDAALFQYFKAQRANIRLKVTLLEWRKHRDERLISQAKTYADLLVRYLEKL